MATRYKIDRAFLRELGANGKYQEYSDQDLRGFGVRVSPTGKITYIIRWVKPSRRQGRRVIGNFPAMGPGQARDLASAEFRNVNKLGDSAAEVLERQRRLEEADVIRGRDETLGSYVDGGYRRHISLRHKDPDKTIKRIQSSFRSLQNLQLSEITVTEIEKWRYQRRENGLKSVTLEREVSALHGLFRRAVQDGILVGNPLSKLDSLPLQIENRVRWLQEDEELRLRQTLLLREDRFRDKRDSANIWRRERNKTVLNDLHNVEFSDHLQPMVLVSLNTGLRLGELLTLQWEMVDLTRRVLTVRAQWSKTSRVRHVPLNDEAFDVLQKWQKIRHGTCYVFEGLDGNHLGSPKTAWVNLLKVACITGFRWHDMRHHFASRLVMGGIDLNTVRELLGHADLKMTLRYAHLAPEHKAAAVAVLNRR